MGKIMEALFCAFYLVCHSDELRLLYPGRDLGGRKPDGRHADAPENLYVYVDRRDGLPSGKTGFAIKRARPSPFKKRRTVPVPNADAVFCFP